jgi:hypothetical protein
VAGKDEAAKRRIGARLEAMAGQALEPPSVDPRTAAVAALMVANFVGEESARKRFTPLVGAKLFDVNALEDLAVAARFVLRVLPKLGEDLDKRDMSPKPTLLSQVTATKEELLRVCERYVGDIDEARGRLITVRLGEGNADLVYDLRMLADLYRDYAETLTAEAGSSYRREAEAEARELANHLEFALLGPLSEEDLEWRSYLHRSLAMLVPMYEEVCRAGRFLFHNEKPEARFPTLASVSRVRRRLKREANRRAESTPPPPAPSQGVASTPKVRATSSIAPEASLVDVSDAGEKALAEAMVSVPSPEPGVPRGRTHTPAPALGIVEEGPKVPTPAPSLGIIEVEPPSLAAPRMPSGIDPIEAVTLDFALPSAGEDVDGDMDTADLDLDLNYASESNFYSDISGRAAGLFIATYVVKPKGTHLSVLLSLPQLEHPIRIKGRVEWVREFSPSIEAPPGMGLAFEPLNVWQRRAVEAFTSARSPILHDPD